MISFCIALCLLILGYFTYGSFVEKVFGANSKRKTPVVKHPDGVDFIPMPTWKMYMIQFLNIAGLGPIFGAIMGAKFGEASFLWIVLGSIFGGAMHDYFTGMLSLRHNGCSLPETIGRYLGNNVKQLTRIFTVVLLIIVGVVFIAGPADLLATITPSYLDAKFWVYTIILYYIVATLFPIDKIIGKIYPIFAFALLFMAGGILVALFIDFPSIPEITDGLQNTHPNPEKSPIFPMMFVSIACGAISGFHATQSPMMARCMTNEKQGRKVFYGAMITEGIVALIWAAAATYFFTPEGQQFFNVTNPEITNSSAPNIINLISVKWLGTLGGILVILGVVFAPITTGDTAFRSARLIIADILKIPQTVIIKRLLITIPLFVVAIPILMYSINNKDGFEIIWRYFAWSNQVLSVISLWAITIYLKQRKIKYWFIAYIPALFMTAIVNTFILFSPVGFGLEYTTSLLIGCIIAVVLCSWFLHYKKNGKKNITTRQNKN